MDMLHNMIAANPALVFAVSTALFSLVAFELVHSLFFSDSATRKSIARRLMLPGEKLAKKKSAQTDILVQLRKERDRDSKKGLEIPAAWMNRLLVQAGLSIPLKKFITYWFAIMAVTNFNLYFLAGDVLTSALLFPVISFFVPYFWLSSRKGLKIEQIGRQLPEAIDLITRSLKAGHPVPISLTMVARQMPDPIASEFGIVVEEINYGSELPIALLGLYDRIGHPDLSLLVSAVSIQSQTGGNLREVLQGLAKVIRDRQKMKAKVKAISAEGRTSAIFLTALPVLLLAVFLAIVPTYYTGIWDKSLAYYIAGGLFSWLVLGNLLIFKMVSFKV